MTSKLYKNCPKCGLEQVYTNRWTLKRSIEENSVCNTCSITHQKKEYSTDIINKIIDLYIQNMSLSKIARILKVKKSNVKNILIEKKLWIEGRDNVKKDFSEKEILDIIERYQNGDSIIEISKHYDISKSPIRRMLEDKKILRKSLSNGKKIILTENQKELIKKLYLEEYKNSDEISEELKLTKPFINKYLSNSGFRRDKSQGNSVGTVKRYRNINYVEYLNNVDEFYNYKLKVMKTTKKQPIQYLSNYEKRGNSGVDGAYHLDHKFSIVEGFMNNIEPEIIGGIKNLEFIPWLDNIKKRTKCSITINELNK